MTVNMGDSEHSGGEVVHNDSQTLVEQHGDDVHEEVWPLAVVNNVFSHTYHWLTCQANPHSLTFIVKFKKLYAL